MAAETALLDLVTPTQGTLPGSWGNTVNNGITEYVDIAIAGTLTLTGDGAVTLQNTICDATQTNITAGATLAGAGTATAQFAVVRISGTTTAKTVTGPSLSKIYIVDNASSFTVTFKASGQAGVSIAAGEKTTVYYNNSDYVKVASTLPVSTVPISSGGTGQTTATAAFDALAPTTTTGDVIYYNGTDNVRLGIGTAGQALIVNSGATAPQWGSAGITTGKSIAMAMIFGF